MLNFSPVETRYASGLRLCGRPSVSLSVPGHTPTPARPASAAGARAVPFGSRWEQVRTCPESSCPCPGGPVSLWLRRAPVLSDQLEGDPLGLLSPTSDFLSEE